jgi:hypothetical protein
MKTRLYIWFPILAFLVGLVGLKGQNCALPTAETEFGINAIKATLHQGGGLWNKRNEPGLFIQDSENKRIPLVADAGIWISCYDPGGNRKVAVSNGGLKNGKSDFFPGQLSYGRLIDSIACKNWDRFFTCTKADIEFHLKRLEQHKNNEGMYLASEIPASIKGWPANGNPYFEEEYGFSMLNFSNTNKEFFDANHDGSYQPLEGDYPAILRDHHTPIVPDEMVYWIFNDSGGIHEESGGDRGYFEVHAIAYAFKKKGVLDSCQFYRYKVYNKATEDADNTRIGFWMNPNLGCAKDDYIGCDTIKSLMYIYNKDDFDEDGCGSSYDGFGNDIPIVGIDLLEFRGSHVNSTQNPMSSFFVFGEPNGNNEPLIPLPSSTLDYHHLIGGDGFKIDDPLGSPTSIVYPGSPDCDDLQTCWNMCLEENEINYQAIMSTDTFLMMPGESVTLTFAVVYSGNQQHPCPSLDNFYSSVNRIKHIFDAGFPEDPVAPDKNLFKIFPNPIKSGSRDLIIEGVQKNDRVLFWDINGKMVLNVKPEPSGGVAKISLKNHRLIPGMYFIRIKNDEKISFVKKLIILN